MALLPDYQDTFGGPGRFSYVTYATRLEEDAETMFLPVPTFRRNLRISFVGRSDTNAAYDTLEVRFGAGHEESEVDSEANYDRIGVFGQASTEDELPAFTPHSVGGSEPSNADFAATTFSEFGNNFIDAGSIPGATSPTGYAHSSSLLIPNYSGATFYKTYEQLAAYRIGVFAYIMMVGGTWKDTAPVRGVQIKASAGNLIAGSTLTLELN